jgi:predicted metalloprotease
MRWLIVFLVSTGAAHADVVSDIAAAASETFARMPQVAIVDQIAGQCGADDAVDARAAYCTTGNRILVAEKTRDLPQMAYLLGHASGHAVQVQHGVADFALREIRKRPDEEVMLRGLVERRVDCIAGFLVQGAGLPTMDLPVLFQNDPLDSPHWGRDPLRIGPVADVPIAERNDWFKRGQEGDIGACAPGEVTGLGLVRALHD